MSISAPDAGLSDRKDWKRSWRQITNRIRTFNVPPNFDPGALIEDIPLEISNYNGAFITRREVVNSKDGVKFTNLAQWYSRGAIYDNHRVLLPEFAESSSAKFDNPAILSAERAAAAVRVPGKCIYLGALHGHFGHFLVESLARAWALLRQDKDVRVIFHYANSTGGIVFPDPAQLGLPIFVSIIFDALGIGAGRLVLANQDLLIDELLVPNIQFRLGKDGIGSPGFCQVYDHIREELYRRKKAKVVYPKKVYLTRTRLTGDSSAQLQKSVVNEREVEALFQARGFEIVSPERIPFDEQIALVSNATHIAGTTGSALHMILFNGNPDAQVFAVDWRNSVTQYILEAARGLYAFHITCFDGRNESKRVTVDAGVVEQALTETLGQMLGSAQAFRSNWQAQFDASRPERQDRSEQPKPLPLLQSRFDLLLKIGRLRPEPSLINYHSLVVWALFASLQDILGVEGDVFESSGSIIDKLYVLSILKGDERAVLAALPHENGPVTQADDLPEDLEFRAERLAVQNGNDAANRLNGRRFRWLHVDVGQSSTELRQDLKHFSSMVSDSGVLVVSHFFDPEAPAVTSAIFDFLASAPEWKILLVAFNDVYLLKAPAKLQYTRGLRDRAKAFLAEFGIFRLVTNVRMEDDEICVIKGGPHKLIQLLRSA